MSANTHLMGFQRGKIADGKKSEPAESKPKGDGEPKEKAPMSDGAGEHSELHGPDENGGYKTKGPGGEQQHPHIGHAMAHLAATHHPMGKHMHIHHDGGMATSHHAGEDGNVEGPNEHGSTDELTAHVGNVMGDGDAGDMGQAAPMHHGGGEGLSGLGF